MLTGHFVLGMSNSGGGPFFGKNHNSFQSAFPDVKSIDVTLEESDMVETQKTRHYNIDTISGQEPCSNALCTQRGIRLDRLVGEMVYNDDTDAEFTESCKGVEKKGQNRHLNCPHMFEVEIEIEYK